MPDTRPTFYGTFRESNAVHLEILEPPIAAGVPIELDIFEGPDGTTMLATLEAAREKRLNPMLGDLGAASFVINRHDPKATPEILRVGNYAKYKIGGKYRFGWWIEDVDWTRVAREEKRGEDVKVAGVGAMGCLKHGTWWVEAYTGGVAPADGKWSFPAGSRRGDILLTLIEELQARPDGPVIPQVGIGWAEGVDSQGAVWDDDTEAAYELGYGALETWKQLTALGLESEMTHDLQLRTYVELGRHFEPAPTGNGAVTLLLGRHILEDHHREHDSRKTRLVVRGAEGLTITVIDPALEAEIGERREGSISVSNSSDPTTLQRAGTAQLQALILETEAIEIPVAHDDDPGGYQPWVHYREGDWIGVERIDGTIEAMRIAGMRLEETVNDYALRLQLNSRRVEALIRLKRMIDALGGGGAGSGTSTGSSIEQGGQAGGGGTTDGRVRVASGDALGYLYDQVDAGNGIGKAIAGAGGAQQLELRLDLPGAIEDDVPAWDAVAGLFVPRPRGAGGGGGGGWADTIVAPATPHADNDEFNDGAIAAAWATIDTGAGVATWTERGDVLSVLNPGGDAAHNMHARVKPLAALAVGDYIETAIRLAAVAGNYPTLGLIFGDGATAGAGAQAALMYQNGAIQMASVTGYNAVTHTGATATPGPVRVMPWLYLRWIYQGANTWRSQWSPDGVTWLTVGDIARTLTPTHGGIYSQGWTFGPTFVGTFDYFRRGP